jgi:ribosomal-protein-alanine N-acetyltransferase
VTKAIELGNASAAVVEVVPMQRKHLKEVLEIEQAVHADPWTLPLFLSELSMASSRAYFVAKTPREIVGYAGVAMAGEDGHVTNVSVHPDWWGRKIGTLLTLAVVEAALARGAKSLTLEVRTNNTVAQALYKKFGFVIVGIRKNYYVATGEDAFIMWARQVDSPAYQAVLDSIRSELSQIGIRCPDLAQRILPS